MDNDKRQLVVVLSRNYSTGLGIIRSLGETGKYDIDFIAIVKSRGNSIIAASSRYLRNSREIVYREMIESEGEILVNALMEYEGTYDGKIVIISSDDLTASILDENREKLEELFLMPGIAGGGSLVEHMNKTCQSRIAAEAGLPVPAEWVISLRDEDIRIPEDMIYPCFVKPLESISGYKTEMKRCNTEEELKAHLTLIGSRDPDRDILVQEFLQIDDEISFSGACLNQEVIIPAVIKKLAIAKHETGVAVKGEMHPFTELGETADKIVKMMQSYGYTGMFDIDLNVCGDRIYFSEVNLRSGGSNYAYARCGVNLPDIFVKYLLGEEITEEEKKTDGFGQTFVYEKIAWEDHIHGHISKEELNRLLSGADITFLANDDDPEPGRVFNKRIRMSAFKHRMLQLIGKEKRG